MRFSTALPLSGALLALVLGTLFAIIFSLAADYRAGEESNLLAERLAKTVQAEIEAGDVQQGAEILERIAGQDALLLDRSGALVSGQDSEWLRQHGQRYPVVVNGEQVATLIADDFIRGRLPLPLTTMLAAVLFVTGVAFAVTNYFAQQTSRQIGKIQSGAEKLADPSREWAEPETFIFSEFRFLQATIVRTLRNLLAENRRLTNAAYTDERTGLGNSTRLTRDLTRFIADASFDDPAAFILIDADDLMQMSDYHDSAVYHEIHAAMARRLAQFVTSQEAELSLPPGRWPVFSLQSDEFGILVDRLGARPEVMKFVRKLLESLRQPYTITGKTIRLPVSAGIVMVPEDGQSPQDIRKRAESALIQAHRTDHSNFQFYSPKLDRQNAARKRLEAEVRAAVENKRFVPLFQPKIDLRTGRIAGAEALARWKLESGRIVSPNVFIPVAESTGLIGDIGAQITRQACRAAARWHRLGFKETSVAVNVSPLQFETEDLGNMIITAMTEAGLPPRLLQLEITESVAVTDPERLKDVIGPLKTMGVKLAIDDFGTGHSNLAMLGRLPFDVFKIDRQFISSLYTDKQAPAIVEMILGMAETLGMETVAEGVETEAQQNFLRRRGCDQYQGFLYSPPVTLDRFIDMLREDSARDIADVS